MNLRQAQKSIMNNLVTTRQATQMLEISKSWLYKQHKKAEEDNQPPLIRMHKIGGKTLWLKSDIERLANPNTTA